MQRICRFALLMLVAAAAVVFVIGEPLAAQETPPAEAAPAAEAAPFNPSPVDGYFRANNVWMMLCAALVFIMHLGFSCVESGLCRAKNCVNILAKNLFVVSIGILTYWFIGFNLMYPGTNWMMEGWLANLSFGLSATADVSAAYYGPASYTYWTDFLFQAMFAATAATIVSGAVAERIKLGSFFVFATLFVAISYPITGSWQWGGGWLKAMGFYDFAGSTLVHSVGGWGALAGAIILGPRLGKYADGHVRPIPGHSMPLAAIGVFLLWLGWFGFNGGSVLSADPALTSLALVTTNLAAAAGVIGAMFTAWIVLKKPDLSMALNGALAGLVGITAGADQMSPLDAIWIGLIAGIIVVFSVVMLDKLKIDDPVGAISVHLVCGVWGTLAVGLFGAMAGGAQLFKQVVGILAIGVFSAIFAFALFAIIHAVMGLRVSEEEETEGLDLGEHGNEAYPDFQAVSRVI